MVGGSARVNDAVWPCCCDYVPCMCGLSRRTPSNPSCCLLIEGELEVSFYSKAFSVTDFFYNFCVLCYFLSCPLPYGDVTYPYKYIEMTTTSISIPSTGRQYKRALSISSPTVFYDILYMF